MNSIDLAAWRLQHAKLTQSEAADCAALPQRHASAIECEPARATVDALRSYVAACGGRLELAIELGGVRRLLVLVALLLAGCSAAEGWQDTADLVAGALSRCELQPGGACRGTWSEDACTWALTVAPLDG